MFVLICIIFQNPEFFPHWWNWTHDIVLTTILQSFGLMNMPYLRCNWSIHFLVSFSSHLTYWKFVYPTNKLFRCLIPEKDLDSSHIIGKYMSLILNFSINYEFQTHEHHVIFILSWPKWLFRFFYNILQKIPNELLANPIFCIPSTFKVTLLFSIYFPTIR